MAPRASTIPFNHPLLKNGTAAVLSVLVHLLAFYVVGWVIFFEVKLAPVSEPAPPNEVVVSLEQLLPENLEREEPQKRPFLDTLANQESETAPENPAFESERNTVATTELPAADPSAEAVPTQEGQEKVPFMELQDHRFVDGPEDKPIPQSEPAPEGVPVPPSDRLSAAPQEQAQPSLEPVDMVETPAEPQENTDPKASEVLENAANGEAIRPRVLDAEAGEEGGAPEVMELAQVDPAQMQRSFSDPLDVLDERTLLPEDELDAMPEERPEPVDPVNPLFREPEAAPNPQAMATPVTQDDTPSVPLQPGLQPRPETQGIGNEAAFSPERNRNKMKGSLSNIGRNAALDAEQTALGKYKSAVGRAIERRWHILRTHNESFVSFGSLKLRFAVDARGKVAGVRVLHDDASAIVKDFSLAAIMTAEIPPMPEEIVDLLGNEPLEVTYDIIIY